MTAKILFLILRVFLTISTISCIKGLDRIREDYCELYCGGSCANQTCFLSGKILTTDDYTMQLYFSKLQIIWTNPSFQQWNIYNISKEPECEMLKVTVIGITSAQDVRLRPGVHYLGLLGISELYEYETHTPSMKIYENNLSYKDGPKTLNFNYLSESAENSRVTNDYIRECLNNTKLIKMYARTSEKLKLVIEDNIFEGKTQIYDIAFSGLKVEGLTEKTFLDLTNLTMMVFSDVVLDNFDFFRSATLRESLKSLTMYIENNVDMKYFDQYSKLEIIDVYGFKEYKNLTAFICRPNQNECYFTMGTNGIPCPHNCLCQYLRAEKVTELNCSKQNRSVIPELPVPRIGVPMFVFLENQLTELPLNTLEGYNSLRSMDVSQNQITSLTIDRLPKALDYLDISFNQITTMSPEVVDYIRKINTFQQYGNKWIVYCDESYLIDYFWENSKWFRIRSAKFHLIIEFMNITASASYLSQFFEPYLETFYLHEDNLIRELGDENLFYTYKLLEELNSAIYLFDGEHDEFILYHLDEKCPYRCVCCLDRQTDEFIINCTNAYLEFYPILPNFLLYNTTLYLDNNDIRKLTDSNTNLIIPGLASIQKLHLSNNKLFELPHHLLPENVTYLDLRNNLLTSLDDASVAFFRYRKEITEVRLSGNPWVLDCKAKSFLIFLREREPKEYEAVLRRVNITQDECPKACICCLGTSKSESLSLIIDCSNKGLREIPPLPTPTIGSTTLIFDRNLLKEWPSSSLPGYSSVSRFHLANNRLTSINELPTIVDYLDISYNNFSVLSNRVRDFLHKRMNSNHIKLVLSGNPWTCSCEEKEFLAFVKEQAKNIGNASAVQCSDTGKSLIEVEEIDICPSVLIYYTSLAVSLLIIALSINVFICFRQPILIWFYEHEICLSLAARRELDQDKKFDAFLSFTHKDEELIDEFVERLENGKHKFKLCFYMRDWLVGESIPECINQSVKDSRRIIILMTKNFLKSTWGRLEFRLALHATSKDRCKRLIVVLYPDVENFDDLDSELRAYMVLNTYLDRNNPNFWNKLIYSMPHLMLRQQLQGNSLDVETNF